MYFSELKQREQKYVAQTYRRYDADIEKGRGSAASGLSGQGYIDFSSGIGVNSLGFAGPGWVEAVKTQAELLAHISNYFYTTPMVDLAKALCERTGMKRVFFGNSGAEANEGAIKTARKYGADRRGKDCYEIVCLENSFHGRTIATLAATGQEVFHQNFGPFPDGFVFAKANDIGSLRSKISEKTCAVMIECIQGEGGVVPLKPAFTDAIRTICRERDILLIADEIQTGVGRTGTFLCCEQLGLRPDIVTLAKGLGGGLPIGAVLFGEKTMDTLTFGDHGSTFGGNPICCAGALAVLDAMDGKFLDQVAEKGGYMKQKLEEMALVSGVTGKGLMIGISLIGPLKAAEVATACLKAGLIVLTAKEKVRFLPPLVISQEEIERGLAIFEHVLQECKEKADETSAENA